MEIVPEGVLFLMNNKDRPGIVGYIGTLMGKHNVNIANMSLSRDAAGGKALTVLNLDSVPPPALAPGNPKRPGHQQHPRGQTLNNRPPLATPKIVTRFFKPPFILAAAAFCLTVPAQPAAAQNKSAAGLFPDPVVATGKGFEIRRSEVQDAFIAEKSLMAEQQRAIPESQRPRVESDILLHLVIDKILMQKATADEKASVRGEVANYFDQVKKGAPSEQLFEQQVKASGKTLDQLKDAYAEKELAQVVLVRELAPSNALSDDAIKKFYDDKQNATNFTVPERVHVAHILISELDPATQQTLPPAQRREKEKLARDIWDRAEKGEDFAALANNTPTTKAPGRKEARSASPATPWVSPLKDSRPPHFP